ncbi:hypothetical protein MNO11_15280 [Serratia plymuthica]|uniref:gp53-like domain-containing protein n=1 Tax=Serratia plymuthica TaxID=82996 RepID=UPI001F53CD2F|nr:hypothetical protein [Serratia plymuthica]UNK26207.1 hypothetical protein MNO11_15280 [Serratia plymuthica]
MQKIGSVTETADQKSEFTNGNVAQGVPPTILESAIFNTWQREMCNVVVGSGITLDPTDDGQMLKAIKKTNKDQAPAELSTNGYQKLPSGLIIQWGILNGIGSTSVTAEFPIKFQNDLFQSVATLRDMSGGDVSGVSIYANWIEDNEARCRTIKVGVTGSSIGEWTAKYIAIGF